MIIPTDKLSAETLEGIIRDFVLREGTDYGLEDFSLYKKIEQVKSQLKNDEILLVFDPISETCNLVPRSRLGDLQEE